MNEALKPDGRTAYAAEYVFDGAEFLEDHAVLIEDGLVSDVVPITALPRNVPLHQQTGCTIVPGLIDTHVHFMQWQGPLFLAYGVTSIRDTGNELQWILACRKAWQENLWPRILSLGPLLDGPSPNHALVTRCITDLDSARAAVRETVAAGVDGIKLYTGIAPAWMPTMVRESHEGGCKVSMHCLANGVLVAGRAGVDEFYHLDGILADVWPDHPPGWLEVWGDAGFAATRDRQRYVADEISDLGMTSTPTLAYWDSQWRMPAEIGPSSEERRYIPPRLARWASAEPNAAAAEKWRRALDAAQGFTHLLLERDLRVLAGTDAPFGGILPGQSLWRELSLLVESGMSPRRALRAATSDAADFLEQPELGRLGKGRIADLALVRGNLCEQLPVRPEIALVVRGGRAYQPEELLQTTEPAAARMQDDPWARQFLLHWRKKTNDQDTGHRESPFPDSRK